MRVDLPGDPAVIIIGAATKLEEDHVVGKLLRLWTWAGAHSEDGVIPGVTGDFVDRCVNVPGFADAMVKAGWLIIDSSGIVFPKWDEHNSECAKKRKRDAKRQAKSREKRHASSVTKDGQKVELQNRTEQNNIEEACASSCPETCFASSEPKAAEAKIVLTYPTASKPAEWHLTEAKLQEYAASFPNVDILAECRKALQWVRDNSKKTSKGMPRFLNSWLSHAQNSGRRNGPSQNGDVGRISRIESPAGKYDNIGIHIDLDAPQ